MSRSNGLTIVLPIKGVFELSMVNLITTENRFASFLVFLENFFSEKELTYQKKLNIFFSKNHCTI